MVFGRLFSRSPLDNPQEKAWTELRMQWLSEQFGVEPLRSCEVLLPTRESLPESIAESIDKANPLLERLCRQMHIPAKTIALQEMDAADPDETLGLYLQNDGKPIIKLRPALTDEPATLVSTLAHELGYQRLLGEDRISTDVPDHEDLTDLVPVYFGLGVFGANDTVHDRSFTVGRWGYFSISKNGYLPSRILGYALALFAWMRGETKPVWANHLRKDARAVLQAGLKYLQKTNDSMFRPETAGQEQPALPVGDLIDHLKTGTPSRKIAALWDLSAQGEKVSSAMEAVSRVVDNDTDAVRIVALQTLHEIAVPDADIEDVVRRQLSHSHPDVRSSALAALQVVATRHDESVPDFIHALKDSHRSVVHMAGEIIASCGEAAAAAEVPLLRPLHRGIVRCDDDLIRVCLSALIAIDADPETLIDEHFQDAEVHDEARDYLRELRREIATATEAAAQQ